MTSKPHRVFGLIAALQAATRYESTAWKLAAGRRITAQLADDGLALPSDFAARVEQALLDDNDRAMRPIIDELRVLNVDSETEAGVILIVEDDRLTARVHADALDGIESQVVIAENAAAADVLLRQHQVSIVLLDLVLPDSDGRDLLLRIRSGAATREIPVVVITGRMDASTQAECFALGADTLLSKPVNPEVLAAVVAGQLDHAAVLRTAGRVDRLTGLANRAALSDTMDHLAPLARRTRRPLSLAMVDLDYFKSVNDTYGHDMGDEVLRRSANTIAQTVRVSDVVARWGGEEFCVLFPETNIEGAVRALTKALHAVRDLVFESKGKVFSVTFSAGVAPVGPKGTAQDALTEADRLLYLAKKSGRNRVLSSADEANPPRPRVLVVEDDDAVGRMVGLLLGREGFDVLSATDGESALRAIEKEYFVLAVVDVDLPIINGFDLVSRMRLLPTSAKMPVLMLTGSAEEENIVRGFEIGANDYVTKPFLPRELAARVKRLVASR